MKKFVSLMSVVLITFIMGLLCGCQDAHEGNFDNKSTSCGNIVMGNGKFAYDNGFIYYTDRANIFEYDTVNKKTVSFSSQSDDVRSMFVQDKYVYFASDGLKRITKDGKKHENVFDCENGCLQLYIENDNAYFLNSIEGTLFCKNVQSLEEKALLENVMAYYVDNEKIYAVAKENDTPYLFISPKESFDFKKQNLSFEPIAVFVDNGEIFLSKRVDYQIIHCSADEETSLPIYSVYYQVLDDKLFYLDSETYKNGCFSLMMYDITTQEKTVIFENVFDFNILQDNYICVQCSTNQNAEYKVFNLETGTIESMNIEEK